VRAEQLAFGEVRPHAARRVHHVGGIEVGDEVVDVLERESMAELVGEQVGAGAGGDRREAPTDRAAVAARGRPVDAPVLIGRMRSVG